MIVQIFLKKDDSLILIQMKPSIVSHLAETRETLFHDPVIYTYLLASSYIYVILNRIFYLLFINYTSLLVILTNIIRLHYAGFYNTSKALIPLELVGAGLKITIRMVTNTVLKAMLVAQRKIMFLLSRIQILLVILPIKNLVKKQFFLFKEKQLLIKVRKKNQSHH